MACTKTAAPIVEVRYQKQAIPPSLLQCADRPPRPAQACQGRYCSADIAHFIIDLAASGEDCREKLAAVKRYAGS